MDLRFTTGIVALSTAFAAPAIADVTAADVWENQQTLFQGMGITLTGDLADDTLSGAGMDIVLPQGMANMQITTDAEISMADNGDGTVTVTYPSPMTVSFAGSAGGEDSFAADVTLTHDSYTIIASGEPDDIAYASQADNLRMELGEVSADQEGMSAEDFDISGFFEMTNWTANSRVTVGDLITFVSESSYGDTTADFRFSGEGMSATNTQTTRPIQATVSATLPIGGSDIMNLSEATRAGLGFTAESTSLGSASLNETMMNGAFLNSQATSVGEQNAVVTFGEEGLQISGAASDFQIAINEPTIFPAELAFAMEKLSANYDVPLNASDEAQDFRVATSLTGVTIDDALWDMFDPEQVLPRDPAEITFDITGVGTNGVDLMDIMALSQMTAPPPIEVDEVTIENLRIAAMGADATATGAMTFDWSDFQTIPGFPRPEGAITVNLNGANTLMDKLVTMGLIPEDQLMMPRMMMGMFALPVGDDMLQSVIEVNEEGHVLANGQRLR